MSLPSDTELLGPSGAVTRLPSLGSPELSTEYLARIKEILEALLGRRGGNDWDRVVTFRDLHAMGGLAGAAGGGMVLNMWQDGTVDVNAPGFQRFVGSVSAEIERSAAFRALKRRIGSAEDMAHLPEEIKRQLQLRLEQVARERMADIQTVDAKIQTTALSMASRMNEITAALEKTTAGVRQFDTAYADRTQAIALQVTELAASLEGVGAVAIEERFEAIASEIDGLQGQWSIKIQTDDPANPVIAGIALAVEDPIAGPGTSSLIFMAEKFGFLTQNGSVMPFGIGSDGNVYISTQLRVGNGGTTLANLTDGVVTYVGEFASAPDVTPYGINDVYKNSTDGNTYILTVTNNVKSWSVWLQSGGNGSPGANAKAVALSAASQTFKIAKDGTGSPVSIVLTGTVQNTAGTPNWTIPAGTATLAAGANAYEKILTLASMTTDSVTIRLAQDGLFDQITINKIREGVDTISGLLSNEAANVGASVSGVVGSFAGTGGTFRVFDGLVDMTGNAAVTYSVAAETGVDVSIAATGVYTPASMSADSGSATLRAVYKGVTIDKVYSIAKSKTGATGQAGVNAARLDLGATSQVFQISKAGTASPASITLTAKAQNLAGTPAFTIPAGTATLTAGATAAEKILTLANMGTDSVTVRVTQDGLTDDVTIIKVREGVDSINGILTNEQHTLTADMDGNVADFTGAGTAMKLYRGITDETASWAYAFAPASSAASLSYTTTAGGTVTVTAMAAAVNSAYVDITASRTGYASVVKRFTVNKTKAGATGGTGGTGATGPRGTVEIAAPTAGTAWSSTEATTALSNAGYGAPKFMDIVTLYNTAAKFAQSRFWDGDSWEPMAAYINGNLVVPGTIAADRIIANGLVLRGASGNALVGEGVPLDPALAAAGTQNSELMPAIAAAASSVFSSPVATTWEFNNSVDGWSVSNGTLTLGTTAVLFDPAAADPNFISPTLAVAGATYDKVRAKIMRTSGTGWDGTLFYATAGHSYSGSYNKTITPDPSKLNEWVTVEWDMAKLTAGGTDWNTSTITAIRLDLGTGADDVFWIDWIGIGRVGPPTASEMGALNKNAADILQGPIALQAGGAIVAGTLTFDANGNRTGGSGTAQTSKGWVGHNGTRTTIAIDATTGKATFSDEVSIGATGYGVGTGLWFGFHSGVAKFRVGDANQYIDWDGTKLTQKLDVFSVAISGTLVSTVGNGAVNYGNLTASIAGDTTGGVTYSWSIISYYGEAGAVQYYVSIGGETATATITGSATNNQIHAQVQLTVRRNSDGRIATAIRNHNPIHGTYNP